MSGWWFAAICLGLFLLIYLYSECRFRLQLRTLQHWRSNPTRDEFVALLAVDCDADIASYLWEELASYWHPATPHPDDDFIEHLSIDKDEAQDWLERYCGSRGFDWKTWPRWGATQATTVRNFARWLSAGSLDKTPQ